MGAVSTVPPTYSYAQLVRAAGTTERAARVYFRRGLLPKPPFRSRNTRYTQEHLIRLRAIVRLREKKMWLDSIGRLLEAATPAELYELAGMTPPPELRPELKQELRPEPRQEDDRPEAKAGRQRSKAHEAEQARGAEQAKPGDRSSSPAQAGEPAPAPRELPDIGYLGPYRRERALATERWDVIAICPGVQLMVRPEADTEAWRVAEEIVRLFGNQNSVVS